MGEGERERVVHTKPTMSVECIELNDCEKSAMCLTFGVCLCARASFFFPSGVLINTRRILNVAMKSENP